MKKENSLKDFVRGNFLNDSAAEISILVGPEGGYSQEEIRICQQAGIIPVSIGKRILRMETAAIVGTALLLYELGEMG